MSSSQSGRNPHGRFYKEQKNAPSPPSDPSSSLDDTPLNSSDDSSSSSSMEERCQKKRKHDCHKRKAKAMKKKNKRRHHKFPEGSKNVSFVTYDGTYGAIDKVFAFTPSSLTLLLEASTFLNPLS